MTVDKNLAAMFADPIAFIRRIAPHGADDFQAACIASDVPIDVFLRLSSKHDALPFRVVYAQGDVIITELTSSRHEGPACKIGNSICRIDPTDAFLEPLGTTSYQLGNYVVQADAVVTAPAPDPAPVGEYASADGLRRLPPIIVESTNSQPLRSGTLHYPFDPLRPLCDRRKWTGLEKGTIWFCPQADTVMDARSNVQEVIILDRQYNPPVGVQRRLTAVRLSRLYPPSAFDADGVLQPVEEVQFDASVCNGLGQRFLHIPLPSIFHPRPVPAALVPGVALPPAHLDIVVLPGSLPVVHALRVDLFYLQASM